MTSSLIAELSHIPTVATAEVNVERIPIEWRPQLPIFSSEAFLKYSADEYGWLGGFDSGGSLRCILPYTMFRKVGLRIARFRTETIALDQPLPLSAEKNFLNGVIGWLQSMKCDLAMPPPPNAVFKTVPDKAVAAPYGTFVVDLTRPEEVRWNDLHSKHRNVIRNAQKKGVQIKTGLEHAEAAYKLISRTLGRSRLSFLSQSAFRRLLEALKSNISIVVAEHQGTVQGCAVIPHSEHSAYYLYGGSSDKPVSGALNLLQWEAMRHFSEMGTKRYDFVGTRINPDKESKQRGLQMFKERFGGTLIPGYLWKYPFGRWKYSVYQLAVRLLRGGDLVDHERYKLPACVGWQELCSETPRSVIQYSRKL